MKQIFLITLVITNFSGYTLAQPVTEHFLASGFSNYPWNVTVMADSGFLLAGTSAPFPGSLYKDTVVVIRLDATGALKFKKNLYFQIAEQQRVGDVIGLNNGKFAILVNHDLCDAPSGPRTLACFDENAEPIWQTTFIVPYLWQLQRCPDGNILAFYDSGQIKKISAQTGQTLWTYNFIGSSSPSYYNALLVPGTEDFFIPTSQRIERWHQDTNNPGGPTYSLYNFYNYPQGFLQPRVIQAGYGQLFACFTLSGSGKIFRWENNSIDPVPLLSVATSNSNEFKGISLGDSTLYALTADSIYRIPFNGGAMANKAATPPLFNPVLLEASSDQVGVFGIGTTGPGISDDAPFFYHSNGLHYWTRVGVFDSIYTLPQRPDAALIQAEAGAPLSIQQFVTASTTIYNFTGGDYSVLLQNNGTEILQEVDVLVSFKRVASICSRRPAKLVHFNQLNLAPGTNIWLHFGDISATNQPDYPDSVCFWVAAPNNLVDADYSNDITCAVSPVGSVEPGNTNQNLISPNPASSTIRLYQNGHFRIFNSLGQLVKDFLVHDPEAQVDISALPPGVYWVHIGNYTEKLIIQP